MFKKAGEFIEGPNKYLAAMFVTLLFWGASFFVDGDWLKDLVFNPFWPILILLITEYVSAKKTHDANLNEKKIERITAVLVEKTEEEQSVVSIRTLVTLLDETPLLEAAKNNISKHNYEKFLRNDPVDENGTDEVIPE